MNDGDRMLVPLYHGTSGIFLPSIKKGGLGAGNPNLALNTFGLLADVLDPIERNWSQEPEFALNMLAARAILDQGVTRGGFNFRHNNVYLSASEKKAVEYALSNPFGSELLSTALSLYEKLESRDKASADQIFQKYPAIFDLRTLANQPLLVEVLCVPIQNLRSETGDNPAELLRRMEDNSNIGKIMLQTCNFELVSTHPPHNLRYYDIEWRNSDPNLPHYTLRPCP